MLKQPTTMSSVFRTGKNPPAAEKRGSAATRASCAARNPQAVQKTARRRCKKPQSRLRKEAGTASIDAGQELAHSQPICKIRLEAKGPVDACRRTVLGTTLAPGRHEAFGCESQTLHRKHRFSHLTVPSPRARGRTDCESQSMTPCRHVCLAAKTASLETHRRHQVCSFFGG